MEASDNGLGQLQPLTPTRALKNRGGVYFLSVNYCLQMFIATPDISECGAFIT